ncbi:MAG: carboxypeptidase regulatory-like domain-containing protein [Cyclobacteriaceae bacterium]
MKNRGGVKKMLLTVVIMCLVWACALGQLSDIRGTVRDADTGVVLQDANVRVMHLPISHLTNANGKFELPRVPMGELELWVSKPGYAFVTLKVTLKASLANIEVRLSKEELPPLSPLMKELNQYRERVVMVTDKVYYYPGEVIWMKGFLNYLDISRKDSLSRVVYVELLDARSQIVKRQILSLDSGQLAGSILIPDYWVPGQYLLRAYSRFMLNFGTHHFFTKVIPILPLNVSVDPSEGRLSEHDDDFVIDTDRSNYGLREKIRLELRGVDEDEVAEGDYAISVTDVSQVVPVVETKLKQSWGFPANAAHEPPIRSDQIVEKGVRFTGRFVSEYLTGKQVTLSVFRRGMTETMEFQTDEKGWFQVNGVKFYDSMTYFYKARFGKKGRDFYGRIQLTPEEQIEVPVVVPGLWFVTRQTEGPQRQLADYLAPPDVKMLEEITIRGKRKEEAQVYRLRGGADKMVEAESLMNFGNLLLSLQGKIPGLIINCAVTPCEVRFARAAGSSFSVSTEPLVLINDIPVGGPAGFTLQNIDINIVDRIEVSRRINVTYGDQGRNGIIAVYLKEGFNRFTDPTSITPRFEIRGFDRPLTFVSPQYDQPTQDNSSSDFRSTLYWSPRMERDPVTGRYTCSFFSSDLPGQYRIVVQGVTREGKAVYHESVIEVKNN